MSKFNLVRYIYSVPEDLDPFIRRLRTSGGDFTNVEVNSHHR
jgi:hypothetical protein